MTIYGQEKDNATWALSKMNMILHGNAIADVRKGDTITSPQFVDGQQLDTFDFVVMNPPFSTKSWSNGLESEYGRFEFGIPPAKNGDYAFLLHALKSLKSEGKAAIILPHGVLFRGNAEATIRTALIRRGYIKGVIGLPPNLFYGTSIPACIVVLDKQNAQSRTGVFMIDASKGFKKDGNKNRLRSQDIHKIVDVFTNQVDLDGYARMVPLSEITDDKNDYNLNIPRYIDSSEPEDLQDLHAHINGGIPESDIDALERYWDAFSQLRSQLFKANRSGYVDLAVAPDAVQQTVLDSTEFQKFADEAQTLTADWFAAHRTAMASIDATTRPADLIAGVGDDLLTRFEQVALLDAYDVYEQLMSYWHDIMHDDVFLIMNAGWVEASRPRLAIIDKSRKLTEEPDLVIGSGKSAKKYKMDLIPPALVVECYFHDDQIELDELQLAATTAVQTVEEYIEEHGVDEGLLSEAINDKGKLSQAAAKAVLKEARAANDTETECCAQKAVELLQAEAATKKAAREARTALDMATLIKYGDLDERDVQALVLDSKWAASLIGRIGEATTDLTLSLVARIQQLGDRYAETVEVLDAKAERLEKKVTAHLLEMGVQP